MSRSLPHGQGGEGDTHQVTKVHAGVVCSLPECKTGEDSGRDDDRDKGLSATLQSLELVLRSAEPLNLGINKEIVERQG